MGCNEKNEFANGLRSEQTVIAVAVGTGVVTEGHSCSREWDDLDPDVPLLVPESPHGRIFLPHQPSLELSVMAWLLVPDCDNFSLSSLADWLNLELPCQENQTLDRADGTALVQSTRLVYLAIREHLQARGLWDLYCNLEQPMGLILRKMEHAGVPVVRGTIDITAEKKETRNQWRGWPARWTSLSRRVHPRWCQTNAVTGRITAKDPSLQNLPRSLRYSVVAPKGRLLVAADLSGADFRAACAMSGDPNLHRMFEEDEDPYVVIGAGAGREARGREREVGKQIALAALYSASPWRLVQDLHLSAAAVERALENYRARFPQLWTWRDELLDKHHAGHELRNPFGRYLAPENDAQVINHPCQSAVADIIKRAMIHLDQRLPDGAYMILQVHDELVTECAQEDAETVATLMVEAMTRPLTELPVPLAAKVGTGRTWAEAVQNQR